MYIHTIKKYLQSTCIYKDIYKPLKRIYIKKVLEKDAAAYIGKKYKKVMGHALHLNPPVTYTEKIQWRKLYDDNPLYTLCADKVAVREYVKKIQKKYNLEDKINFPQWYGIYDQADELDFQTLPDKFVLKSNHASGQVIICSDIKKMKFKNTKRELNRWIRTNFYYVAGEKHYKNIKPKIICEEFLEKNIIDYRIFCFDGVPYLIKVTQHNDEIAGGYDGVTFYTDWTKADITWNKDYGELEINKPDTLADMLEIAHLLSQDFSFVRVDLYTVENKIYFGELTFTPNSGLEKDISYEWDKKLGEKFSIDYYNMENGGYKSSGRK